MVEITSVRSWAGGASRLMAGGNDRDIGNHGAGLGSTRLLIVDVYILPAYLIINVARRGQLSGLII